jgi:hypothetical protein
MIRNFEEQTESLSKEELELVPLFITGLETKIGKKNSITGKAIRNRLKEKSILVSDARVRKIINHIRVNGLVKHLCATSNGYYVAATHFEIYDYLKSLHERISAQQAVYNVMHKDMQKTDWKNEKV